MPERINGSGHTALVQPTNERIASAGKFGKRYEHRDPEHPLGFMDHEYTQQVGLRSRIARRLTVGLLGDGTVALAAHENPELAHHNGSHGDRVEHTLQSLLLNTVTNEQKEILEEFPVILGGVSLFPREHDFLHQVLLGQRNIDEHEVDPKNQLKSKPGHDIAAGVIMAAQATEIEDILREAYSGIAGVTEEDIKLEAKITGILGQIVSSPHGFPGSYEGIIGQKDRGKKAYTSDIDTETGGLIRVPRGYKSESEVRSLSKDYRAGNIDPFTLNQAQMMAIMTYEVSRHNPKRKVVAQDMSTYTYGEYPDGLHPEMLERYGDKLADLARDERSFEEILPKEIMEQRSVIERVAKLALLADTFDYVADSPERVVRSLLTQKTFTGDNPRPIWQHGLQESDIPLLVQFVETSNGNWEHGVHDISSYSLGSRLDWEIRHWFPLSDQDPLKNDLQQFIGDVSLMAHLEQFRIIRAWMSSDENDWKKVLDQSYERRVEKYKEKMAKREPGTVWDASWISDEKDEVMKFLRSLRDKTGEYTDEDRHVFDLYEQESLRLIQKQYGISFERLMDLKEVSVSGEKYASSHFKDMYDVIFTRGRPPLRG